MEYLFYSILSRLDLEKYEYFTLKFAFFREEWYELIAYK